MAAAENKKTKGRQKIEMKKIENDADKLITFSKRKAGIYKKASELVTLTGAQVGCVMFSPAGKPYSFAHPSFEHVANRFLGQDPAPTDVTHPLVEAHRQIRIDGMNQELNEAVRWLDAEKEREKELKEKMKRIETKPGWWNAPIEDQNMQELLQTEASFKEFREKLIHNMNKKTNAANGASASSLSYLHQQPLPLPPPPPPPAAAAAMDDAAHDQMTMIANYNPFVGSDDANHQANNPHGGFDYGHNQF